MSLWTHVAGVIRVDAWSGKTKKEFEPIIGKEVFYDSSDKRWSDFEKHPDEYVPTGSEGSLMYTVWKNPKECMMACNTITIFGDLRDYTDVEAIEKWFTDILYNRGLLIRNAVMVISCENGVEKTIIYEDAD